MKTWKKIITALSLSLALVGGSMIAAAPANAFSGYSETVTCPAGTRYQYVVMYNSSGATIGINTSNGTSYAGSSARPAAHYHYTWARTTTYSYWGSGSWNFRYQYYCQS